MFYTSAPITLTRFLREGLAYYRRIHLAVILGAAAGAAVLVGAFLVGDSVRGSLRRLTLDRLGRFDEVLLAPNFFRQQLADELSLSPDLPRDYSAVVPAIIMEASLAAPRDVPTAPVRRANRVSLLAVDQLFWQNDLVHRSFSDLATDDLILNAPLAERLSAKVGDELIVRLATPSDIPRDSALGRKTGTLSQLRLRVRQIIPAEGLGRFSIRPDQSTPLLAFMDLARLQRGLNRPDRVNALLVAGDSLSQVPPAEIHRRLQDALRPTPSDLELDVTANALGFFVMSSGRMILAPGIEDAARRAAGPRDEQPVLTYLANSIRVGMREVPYSTIAAIDFSTAAPLGPLTDLSGQPIGPLADNEMVLNQWAADDLQAHVGDELRIAYFEPESTHGEAREVTTSFRLKAICPLSGLAADRSLTPELPGVTDKLSIEDWDPPFPFDSRRVRPKDEDYWDEYRTVPKAFVSLDAGRRMWSSRFGNTTSLRVAPMSGEPVDAETAARLAAAWAPDPAAAGMVFMPVKAQGLAASSGTTPFEGLFLGFSMFLIVSAVMLVALLFRLGVEQRASNIGILLSTGWSRSQVRRWLLAEGLIVSMIGSAVGVGLGIGYAWAMLVGLRTWWVAAVREPFLQLYVTPTSLALGYVCGVIASVGAVVWGLWQLRHSTARELLAGVTPGRGRSVAARRGWWPPAIAAMSAVAAGGLSVFGGKLSGPAQAGAFFGAGFLVLIAMLAVTWSQLSVGATGSILGSGRTALLRLALRNGARFPSRSALTIGLMSAASFLILAISAFRIDPPSDATRRDTGTGGFTLVAESDQPIYQDLNNADQRADLGLASADEKKLVASHATFYQFRVHAGDDASCLNLYQTTQPRVLGVPDALIDRGGFAWGATQATFDDERNNPWLLLRPKPATIDQIPADDAPVPVILDEATAIYSLHLSGPGDTLSIADGRGRTLNLYVAGLLRNSLLQGVILMHESAVLKHFPDVSGYRFFLIDAPQAEAPTVADLVNNWLGDYGMDVVPSRQRLENFMAVQNTYLETFRSLGGLGLLLGTLGLASVQLRNILERRTELALLRAAGFARGRLARLVLYESTALLVAGLAAGAIAAIVALLPHLGQGEAAIPWLSLAGTIAVVLVAGVLASLTAVRAVLTAPLLESLRSK